MCIKTNGDTNPLNQIDMKNNKTNLEFLTDNLECVEIKGTDFSVEPLFFEETMLVYICYRDENGKMKSTCVHGNKNFKLINIK